jgi:hypothetical protein
MNAITSRSTVWFLVAQLAVVSVAIGLGVTRLRQDERLQQLPAVKQVPLKIEPLYDHAEVVSDDQLQAVLDRLKPAFRGRKTSLNDVDHALRFWGQEAVFVDEACLSGAEMRDLITDNNKFVEFFGKDAKPLVVRTPQGVRVRTQEGFTSSSHVDHTLAVLAEIGTPLNYPLVTARGPALVGSILMESLRDFSLNQVEYEWSALAYALYSVDKSWYSREGQQITYDRLAHRMMRQAPSEGVCFGNHRLYGLVTMLRIDEQAKIFTPAVRQEVIEYLQRMTAELVQNQSPEGYLNGSWGGGRGAAANRLAIPPNSLTGRLLVTGHALEWWAIAPAELLPPRETLVRAGQWLCRTIAELEPKVIDENYSYLTHAGKALSMWRRKAPAEALHQELMSSPESSETEN